MKKFVFILIITLLFSSCVADIISDKDVAETEEIIIDDNNDNIDKSDDVAVNFVNNNSYAELGVTEGMNKVICEYFSRYFSALGNFTDCKFDDLFYFDTEYQRGVVNTMVAYQNMIRRDMSIDLSYSEATVGVTYRSVDETDKGIDVYLVQNDYMNYNFIPDITSYTSDIEHHFTLREIEGNYYIVEHSEITGVYTLIVETFDRFLLDKRMTLANLTPAQIVDSLSELNLQLVDNVKNELIPVVEERNAYNASPDSFVTSIVADNPYNADEAIEYSYQWVDKYGYKRNPQFTAYDVYGGNCNNFTSQCLLAGGVPMDLRGKQWKWYGEDINNTGGRYGRSSSWAACEYFYEYCAENTGYGLVTDVSGNLYSGRPGDIIQYLSDGIAVHSVIITKVIYDDDGNVVDYLINSNTTDKVDCPMSLYGYTDFRLIKIIGYNN